MTVRRRTTRAGFFAGICGIFLLIDAGIVWYAFGRCIEAGDQCSRANEWVDSVTFLVSAVLIVLILGGTVMSLVQRIRETRRRNAT